MLVNINKFKNYTGVRSKPLDFDDFWNKGKKEVDKLGTNYTLKKVDIPSNVVDFYHLYFKGIGNAKVHAQLLMPKKLSGLHQDC